ncbi:MAG: galactokinase [bacterium]
MGSEAVSTSGGSVDRATERMTAMFGAPDAVGCATGRVNLIGDHVDYAGGFVLPMPTRETTAVAVRARRSRTNHADDIDVLTSESDVDATWERYARGMLHELRAAGVGIPAVELVVASDVPIGAGLSSSAALEVAVARAALALTSTSLPPRELALLAQRAEHVHAGVPCGIMDQWCVVHADPNAVGRVAIHLDCARLEHEPLLLPNHLRIEVIDSGVRHALRDGGYAARRADIIEAARRIGCAVERLSSATTDQIARLPDRIARRARHVVTEVARVRAAVVALRSGDLAAFGRLLDESHASLRDDFDVSTPEVDRVVESARARGALGARMTGGGFGGSVVAAFYDRG